MARLAPPPPLSRSCPSSLFRPDEDTIRGLYDVPRYIVLRYSVRRYRVDGVTDRLDRWADPPLLVLASLAEEPKHGYAITQDVAETMGVRLSAGTLYAVIARLEARGLIEPLESDDRRRPYRITMAAAGPRRHRPLPALLAGPLRRRDPGAPRRLRRRAGRRRQPGLARAARLVLPAPASARPAGPDAGQPGYCARVLVHADRLGPGLRPAHPVAGPGPGRAPANPLGLCRLRRHPGHLGADRRARRTAAVAADAAPGLARAARPRHGIPAAPGHRSGRLPGRPDRDDPAGRRRERGQPGL